MFVLPLPQEGKEQVGKHIVFRGTDGSHKEFSISFQSMFPPGSENRAQNSEIPDGAESKREGGFYAGLSTIGKKKCAPTQVPSTLLSGNRDRILVPSKFVGHLFWDVGVRRIDANS